MPRTPVAKKYSLPDPVGIKITVAWKYEDTIARVEIGPVVVTFHTPYEAWKKKHGVVGPGIPFGSTPDGLHRLKWMSRSEAERIAAYYDVELEVH